jgi:hypothetical protein
MVAFASGLHKGDFCWPVVAYGRGERTSQYPQELATLGASPIDPETSDRDGYALMNLSPEMSHESANRHAIAKAFTYLPRGYSF